MNAAMFSRKICQFELQPWMNSSAGPGPRAPAGGPVSSTLTCRPSISSVRWSDRQSTPTQVASSPSA